MDGEGGAIAAGVTGYDGDFAVSGNQRCKGESEEGGVGEHFDREMDVDGTRYCIVGMKVWVNDGLRQDKEAETSQSL